MVAGRGVPMVAGRGVPMVARAVPPRCPDRSAVESVSGLDVLDLVPSGFVADCVLVAFRSFTESLSVLT